MASIISLLLHIVAKVKCEKQWDFDLKIHPQNKWEMIANLQTSPVNVMMQGNKKYQYQTVKEERHVTVFLCQLLCRVYW
jgi:hypothetical protein